MLARAQDAFRRALRFPFREDARLADDLTGEASPVLDALSFAVRAAGDDPRAIELREGLAMAGLLGRRAALQNATPSVALALVDALEVALGETGCTPGARVLSALRTVVVEGYCAAIEERIREDAARRAAAALAPLRIAPRCWALIVAGEQEAELVAPALDGACRTLLDADARVCLVHLAITSLPTEDLAAAVLGLDATARMIGVELVWSGVDERWLAAARPRLDPSHLTIAGSLEQALARALDAAGTELREPSPLLRRFRRLLGSEPRRGA